jgi:hypothetical protein
MATGTAGTTAKRVHQPLVHRIWKDIAYTDGASAVVTVGVIPAGSVVIRGGVVVTTAFNAGTANVMDLGTSADDDGFGTDLALGTIGVISADEMATTNDANITADTTVIATLALTGTAASAGAGTVWVEYIVKN